MLMFLFLDWELPWSSKCGCVTGSIDDRRGLVKLESYNDKIQFPFIHLPASTSHASSPGGITLIRHQLFM